MSEQLKASGDNAWHSGDGAVVDGNVTDRAASGEAGIATRPLRLESVCCCLCGQVATEPVAVGEDFEYRTSPDSFIARRCDACSLLYLDPRPSSSEHARIYPSNYHAFEFDADAFGFVHRVRRRLEARRLAGLCRGLADDAVILDVGCGDGFHLDLLREFGQSGWSLRGVDLDARAVRRAKSRGLDVVLGTIESADLPENSVDLALCIMTVEHASDPVSLMHGIARTLKPGGRVLVITDNAGSPDARLFGHRWWGGYHFPRHWNLFDRRSIASLAKAAGLRIESSGTMTTPVNWTYSVRNMLDDLRAPRALVEAFSLSSPVALGIFTLLDGALNLFGFGGALRVVMQRPLDRPSTSDEAGSQR